MSTYILRRVLSYIPVLILVSIFTFGILRVIPGDALVAMMGERQGMNSEEMQRARAEMDEVLGAASKEVSAVIGQDITLQFQVVDRPPTATQLRVGLLAPPVKITALVARDRGGRFEVLAEVTFGELGYPASLRWEDRHDSFSDRRSFEEVLQELLAHSATGAKIKRLMSSP